MSKKSSPDSNSSDDSAGSARDTSDNEGHAGTDIRSLISGYNEEAFPHLQLDREAALRILDSASPTFRGFVDTEEKADLLVRQLKGIHLAAYIEYRRENRKLRTRFNLEKLSNELDRFESTLDNIFEIRDFFDAMSVIYGRMPGFNSVSATEADARDFHPLFNEMTSSLSYLQSIASRMKWAINAFAALPPDEQESFFFGGDTDRERNARQTFYAYAIKGRSVGPITFTARQIAKLYSLICCHPISLSRTPTAYSHTAEGEKRTEHDRQFYDGDALRLACAVIRELRLDEFLDADLVEDLYCPFPWNDDVTKNVNPWEKVKNKIGRIWEDDKVRADKDQLYSWAPDAT